MRGVIPEIPYAYILCGAYMRLPKPLTTSTDTQYVLGVTNVNFHLGNIIPKNYLMEVSNWKVGWTTQRMFIGP